MNTRVLMWVLVGMIGTMLSACTSHNTKVQDQPTAHGELSALASVLDRDFGGTWQRKDRGFGDYLSLASLPDGMKMGTFIICSSNVHNINAKLGQANISAPFKIVCTTAHFQVLTWLKSDDPNVVKLIDIVRRRDP